jgi:hypothetical protein
MRKNTPMKAGQSSLANGLSGRWFVVVVGLVALGFIVAGPVPDLSAFHPGHHKRISVTMLDSAGRDYPCDDSDGPDKTAACQIHCVTDPCMEPYRLCLAHAECSAVAVNSDLSYATLKKDLFEHILPNATSITSLSAWDAWWENRTHARLRGGSYASSCSECSLRAGTLSCAHCLSGSGPAKETWIAVADCVSGSAPNKFENVDGQLKCCQTAECHASPPAHAATDASGEAGAGHAYHRGKHKSIALTMESHAGEDYPCDDADGEDDGLACQIRCVRKAGPLSDGACMEPCTHAVPRTRDERKRC